MIGVMKNGSWLLALAGITMALIAAGAACASRLNPKYRDYLDLCHRRIEGTLDGGPAYSLISKPMLTYYPLDFTSPIYFVRSDYHIAFEDGVSVHDTFRDGFLGLDEIRDKYGNPVPFSEFRDEVVTRVREIYGRNGLATVQPIQRTDLRDATGSGGKADDS
jgi:hypothetical protein